MYPEIPLAQQIIQACRVKNIRNIVISPGSRNAPLTIGFSNDNFFQCYSIVDERCAGFFALGMAQQLNEPVVVVCTSGSAVLNYYPAVSEAFYSNIPLVIISADRPEQKIDIGDGQTIRQNQVMANHTACSVGLFSEENMLSYNEYQLNQSLNICREKRLPVHINAPFEEPLYKKTDKLITFRNQSYSAENEVLNEEFIQKFCSDWNRFKKKLILVGVLPPNSVQLQWIEFLAKDNSVLVLTETISNLHHHSHIMMIDTFLTSLEKNEVLKKNFVPQMLVSFGGMVVSKKIKDFLRNNSPSVHYHIDPYVGYDTYFCLTHHFKASVNDFFKQVNENLCLVTSDYKSVFTDFMQKIHHKRKAFLSKIPFSDMQVYQDVLSKLPQNIQLQISNSSAIRYAQLFDNQSSWRIFCNRGTSGIDGSTSTALGAAVQSDLQTIFITGDLSFFYDSNALWNAYTPKNFRIILINNQGGGIFRILPADKTMSGFETFFETPHHLTAEHLCKMYGWKYKKAYNSEELHAQLTWFFEEENAPKLVEIFTPRHLNDVVLAGYFQFLKDSFSQSSSV